MQLIVTFVITFRYIDITVLCNDNFFLFLFNRDQNYEMSLFMSEINLTTYFFK
jgi:hypothetical protein